MTMAWHVWKAKARNWLGLLFRRLFTHSIDSLGRALHACRVFLFSRSHKIRARSITSQLSHSGPARPHASRALQHFSRPAKDVIVPTYQVLFFAHVDKLLRSRMISPINGQTFAFQLEWFRPCYHKKYY